MKVWVREGNYDYGGFEIIGIFDTLEEAEKPHCYGCVHDSHAVEEFTINEVKPKRLILDKQEDKRL